jgi:N-acyl-D-aspartate/D-glutamate deacylase
MRKSVLAVGLVIFATAALADERYDVVIRGGRVVDPETGLDAIRDVGLRGGSIARISTETLSGNRVIDARGLVVAPGFIDLHQHQQDTAAYRLKALDGVTTALELEIGVPDIGKFVEARRGKTLINFGATACHECARYAAWDVPIPAGPYGPNATVADPSEGPVLDGHADPERLKRIVGYLRTELDAGALGVGLGLEYTPGATREEIIEIFRVAAEYGRPIYVHIRSAGRIEPGSSIEAVEEVIGAAAVTGAPLHIVHLNSMCMRDAPECLRMVAGARARGLDVTTEAYPYSAFMCEINSGPFAPGWREKYGMDYSDVVLPDTNEHLTQARFDELRAKPGVINVLGFLNPDEVVDEYVTNPLVMIASDGIKEHPRNAGSYAHVYARYVRQQGSITLVDAIRKMSLMPAQRLEGATAAARHKGRLQVGADADVVVFDPARFEDKATYVHSDLPSVGMRYVLVNGQLVVNEGQVVEGAAPGRAIVADARTP